MKQKNRPCGWKSSPSEIQLELDKLGLHRFVQTRSMNENRDIAEHGVVLSFPSKAFTNHLPMYDSNSNPLDRMVAMGKQCKN